MKKFFKLIYFIFIAALLVFVYNYFSGDSLFSIEDFHTPSYQEEVAESTEAADFEKLYYPQLDDEEKKIYDKVYYCIKDCKPSVRIYQDIDGQDLFDIVNFVLAENPELFWSDGACSVNSNGKLTFDYIYTAEEIEIYKSQIENNTKNIIAQANAIPDEYERALFLFDFIADNTAYDYEAVQSLAENPQASTIAGVFLNKKAVCGGYAKAYQYLLTQCSLNAETVYGDVETSDGSQRHAWTLQYLDGNYYYTDATWGDSYEGDIAQGNTSHVYFCITEKDMSKTHTPDSNVIYPKCTAKADNYFVKEGLCFYNYSKGEIRKTIRSQIEKENYFIEMKFENESDYKQAVSDLITDGDICYLLLEIDPFQRKIESDRLSYNTDDQRNVLTLILNKK